jgi:ADP-ribosyl-[dinitrogen reductase] hydrolase
VLRSRFWFSHDELNGIAAGNWVGKSRDEISSSGYVIATLEAALWCVHRTSSFEEAVILAVNLGHDSDTVAAVTGQLAGLAGAFAPAVLPFALLALNAATPALDAWRPRPRRATQA